MYYLSGLPMEGHRMVRIILISQLLPLVFQDYGMLVVTLLDVTVGTQLLNILTRDFQIGVLMVIIFFWW